MLLVVLLSLVFYIFLFYSQLVIHLQATGPQERIKSISILYVK